VGLLCPADTLKEIIPTTFTTNTIRPCSSPVYAGKRAFNDSAFNFPALTDAAVTWKFLFCAAEVVVPFEI